ncbi:hypothetical protein ONS95_004444 [Cadophora gregata]|uniref:uncharacterized protein n=1 Tax=Cadophora gregata TaxID=51156 RepID=UPI0026DB319B|nr:uncharacterized protein ONS95_004444 [Cadophora gregata]KAK0105158.1 hypothetical protein ONS96_004559 [Cadophora gregata f. sp. sojae]KAK0105931.1 hypothetical protein ONS95_004444 [Cadophora gregata]
MVDMMWHDNREWLAAVLAKDEHKATNNVECTCTGLGILIVDVAHPEALSMAEADYLGSPRGTDFRSFPSEAVCLILWLSVTLDAFKDNTNPELTQVPSGSYAVFKKG